MLGVPEPSIKWKLTWLGLLASGTALLLACAAFVAYDLVTYRAVMARKLSIQADIIGSNSVSALLFSDSFSATETLAALKAEPRIAAAAIYTPDGRAFARYVRPNVEGSLWVPERLEDHVDGHRFGTDDLAVSRRVLSDDQLIGLVYIRSDLREMQARLVGQLSIAGVVLLASLLLALVISSRLQRTISGPISHLAQTARTVSVDRDYSVRAVTQSRDEVGLLVEAFNEMLAQIQRRDRDLQAAHAELEQRVVDRTRKLEAANRELEAFTYTVSHDLKAPLRGMAGFAQALEQDYAGALDDTGRRYLGVIQSGANRMGELIDDLLRYSRLERREMKRERVQLRPLLDDVCHDLQEEIQSRAVAVRVEPAVEAVEAEREGLREALANLVGNAVKFSRESGGTITIESRYEGDAVLLSVADTGIGFDMKYHDRIFGIFERLHRQEDYPGTGVGLAIVRKVAERHRGRAWAVSEPGKGSTFYLALPTSAGGQT